MSLFDQANPDVRFDGPTAAAPVGFIEAFGLSHDAVARASSEFGVGSEMMLRLEEQDRKIAATGIVPQFRGRQRGIASLLRYAEALEGTNDDPEVRVEMEQYDAAVRLARERDPSIRTVGEVWADVRQRARDADAAWSQARTTWGGMAGGFIGGTLAGLDPVTNPFGFATLGLGGVGKTVAARIGTEAGIQGAVAGIQELTGVASDRRALGLESHSLAETVALGALAGGVLRGAGEGVAAGIARFRPRPEVPVKIDAAVEPPAARPEPVGDGLHFQLEDELPLPHGLTKWEVADARDAYFNVRDVMDATSGDLTQLRFTLQHSDPGRFQSFHGGGSYTPSAEAQLHLANPELAMHLSRVDATIRNIETKLRFSGAMSESNVQALKQQLEGASRHQLAIARRGSDPVGDARLDELDAIIAKVEQKVAGATLAVPKVAEAAAKELAALVTERAALETSVKRAEMKAKELFPAGAPHEPREAFRAQYRLPTITTDASGKYTGRTIFSKSAGEATAAITVTSSVHKHTAEEAAALSKAAAAKVDADLQALIDDARKRLAEPPKPKADGTPGEPTPPRPELEAALRAVSDDYDMIEAMQVCARR